MTITPYQHCQLDDRPTTVDSLTIQLFTQMMINEHNYSLTEAEIYVNRYLYILDNFGYSVAYEQFIANLGND